MKRRAILGAFTGLFLGVGGCLELETESTTSTPLTESATSTSLTTTRQGPTETTHQRTETSSAPEPSPIELTEEWRVFVDPTGTPIISGTSVYTATERGITRLERDGTKAWVTPIQEGGRHLSTRLAKRNESLFVILPSYEGADVDRHVLVRISIDSGTIEATRSLSPLGQVPPLIVSDDSVLTGTQLNDRADNYLRSYHSQSLESQWSKTGSGVEAGDVHNRTAYLVIITESGRQLQALNPRTGEVLWSTEVPVDRVKVTNESLFLTHSAGKELVSWDKQTRERNWSLERPTNEPPRTTLFKPVITDAYGLFAGGHGLVVFDPETGEKQWETSVENAINNPPVMLDGRVWMSTGDSLLGFDIETGETVRTQNLVAKIRDVLVVDTLLIVLMENQIAAFSVQER